MQNEQLFVLFQVIFAPRHPGAYIAELHIVSSPVSDQPQEAPRIPTLVTLQAIAENPNIQVCARKYKTTVSALR